MALRGLAYSVRMSAYNTDGVRVTGLASTITATLWADSTTTILSGTITEIGTTGVYVVPLTAEQMTAYNLCITAVSSTAGITLDPVYLDTEAGRVDVATSSRLATSGYTTPPTVAEVQTGLATEEGLTTSTTAIRGDISTVGSAVSTVDTVVDSIAERMPTSGTITTTDDIPTPPTGSEIAESVWTRSSRLITGGAPTAASISTAVWSATERTLTDTPTYNGPTPAEIANAVGSVDLTALPNASVGSLKTLVLLQTNTGMTSERLTVYETDGTEHTHYDVITDPDTGIQSVRIPEETYE